MAEPRFSKCSLCNTSEAGFYYLSHGHENWTEYDFSSCGMPLDMVTVNINGTVWYPEWYFNLMSNDELNQVIQSKGSELKKPDCDDSEIDAAAVMAADAVEAAIVTINHMTTQFMCLKCTKTDKYLDYAKFIIENKFDIEKCLKRRAQGCGAAEKLMENDCKSRKNKLIKDVENEINKLYCYCPICNRKIAAIQYAPHLDNCMSTGGQSQESKSKKHKFE